LHAGGAKVVLLDEPSSGMNRGEAERAVELISEITRGKSVALASRRL